MEEVNIMGADPKRFEFQTKEDLIVFLSLIIELTIKHNFRYKIYFEELLSLTKKIISDVIEAEIGDISYDDMVKYIAILKISEKYKKNANKFKYSYIEYKSIDDKIANVQGQLLNLLGDRTNRGGVSYWRFRSEYNKMVNGKLIDLPELESFSEDFNATLNKLYSYRNYTHHMTDAKFIEWKNYREKQLNQAGYKLFQFWPSDSFEINMYENVSIDWIFQLLFAQNNFRNDVKKVLTQMKKDYSKLYGKHISIRMKWDDVMDCSHFEISNRGIDRHKGKIK